MVCCPRQRAAAPPPPPPPPPPAQPSCTGIVGPGSKHTGKECSAAWEGNGAWCMQIAGCALTQACVGVVNVGKHDGKACSVAWKGDSDWCTKIDGCEVKERSDMVPIPWCDLAFQVRP